MSARELEQLHGLGPKSRALLNQAGIDSPSALQALGSVAAFARVRQQQPGVSLNLLWALEGALTQTHWQVVARRHRTSLLLALESHDKAALQIPRKRSRHEHTD